MSAQIIRPSLEERDLDRQPQRSCQHGHVTPKQLILERPGAGRNDHAPAGQQSGHEVGEGLADAGAGFDDERFAERQCAAYGGGHGRLFRAKCVARQGTREGSRRAENVFIVGIDDKQPEVISLPHETVRTPRSWISAYSSISTEYECIRPVSPDVSVHQYRSHEGIRAARKNARYQPNSVPPRRDPSQSPQRTPYGKAPRT